MRKIEVIYGIFVKIYLFFNFAYKLLIIPKTNIELSDFHFRGDNEYFGPAFINDALSLLTIDFLVKKIRKVIRVGDSVIYQSCLSCLRQFSQ